MKLLKSWEDTKYNVHNYLYKNDSGLQVLHTLNKQTLDTFVSLTLKAGTYFEKDQGVPNGTAHFLEHMLCNPNYIFKTEAAKDLFNFGNSKRAEIISNAFTGFKYMYFSGYCNSSRENDLMKLIYSRISYPLELFQKHIEKERKIILAEYNQKIKLEKDSVWLLQKFALEDRIHNSNFSVIGETEKLIKSITVKDLTKYYKNLFTIDNCILSIHSPNKISKNLQKHIDLIATCLEKNNAKQSNIHIENIIDEKRIGYFFNTETKGVKLQFFKVDDRWKTKNIYYKKNILKNLRAELFSFLLYKELRERKGFVYSVSRIGLSTLTWEYRLMGFEIILHLDNLTKTLEIIYKLSQDKGIKFLNTSRGRRWFENELSYYIFPHTVEYDREYAEGKSTTILRGYEIYNFEKDKKIAQNTTVKDLIDILQKDSTFKDFILWVDTPNAIEDVKKIIEKSKLTK